MKRIKDPKKIVKKQRLANLAFWVSQCAQNGWTLNDIVASIAAAQTQVQPEESAQI